MNDEVYHFLVCCGGLVLSSHQHGFSNGKSCLNLLETFNVWKTALDHGCGVDYLDNSKAFDTVPHAKVMNKLQTYDFCGNLEHWITSFLTDNWC